MRAPAMTAAGFAAVAAVLAASAVAAGTFGLVLAADAVAAAVLLLLLIVSSRPSGPTPAARFEAAEARRADPSRTRARVFRRRRIAAGGDAASFPAYRKIRSELSWAAVSMRHYDHTVRPLLSRILIGRLADRHRIDPVGKPSQARVLLGEDLWPLLDPARPPSQDSNMPGVDLATLTRIVARLEQL